MTLGRGGRLRGRALQDLDDRVALTSLALSDDPSEPAPVIADRLVGGPRGTAPPDAPRLGDALHEAPRLGVGQCEACGPV